MVSDEFSEDYFERGIETGLSCYSNYRWIPELTIPLCDSIVEWTNLYYSRGIKKSDTILDYGCAKGYLVKGFRLLHYDCYGVDVSEYAIRSCPSDVKDYVHLTTSDFWSRAKSIHRMKYFDWIICKDVLEHIDECDIDEILLSFRLSSRHIAVIVPLGDGKKFNVPAYEFDTTHKIRRPLLWWKSTFERNNLHVEWSSLRVDNIKENYSHYKDGNGFFLLKSLA